MHFTNKIWHRLLQSVHANRSAQEPGSLSLSSSICGLPRFKKRGDGADQLKLLVPFVHHPASWKFSDVWRLVVTIRFRGIDVLQPWIRDKKWCLGGGKHYGQVDSGSLKCGAADMGDPQFGWTGHWRRSSRYSGGTKAVQGSHDHQSPSSQSMEQSLGSRPRSQGYHIRRASGQIHCSLGHALFGLFSDVLRGQISKAGMTKELVIELQESWQRHKRDSVQVGHLNNEKLRPLLRRLLPGLTVYAGSGV